MHARDLCACFHACIVMCTCVFVNENLFILFVLITFMLLFSCILTHHDPFFFLEPVLVLLFFNFSTT